MSLTSFCLLCGYPGSFSTFYSDHKASCEPLSYLECPSCKFVFLEKFPTQEEIAFHYQDVWNREGEDPVFREKSLRSAEHLLTSLKAHVQPGRFLDVGAGAGFYMEAAEKLGWEAYGVDPAIPPAQTRQDKFFSSTLEEAHFQHHFFDLCLIHHTLSHLPNPLGTLKEVFRILKDEGVLLVVIPNFLQRGQKTVEKNWGELIRGKHLYLFSPETAQEMIVKAGFEVFSVDTSQSLITGEQIEKLNIPLLLSIKNFLASRLKWPKQMLRKWIGYFYPGPSIKILAQKVTR